MLLNFILTLVIGGAVGLLFFKLKIPGGLMVGAIVGVTAFNILSGDAYMPYGAKFLAQSVAGAFIGSTIEKDDVAHMPRLVGPILTLLGCLLVTNLAVGLAIWLTGPIDLLTALMAAVPGGMSDTPIIAADMGADAAKVAVLQFVRMASGIGIFPSIILALNKNTVTLGGEEAQGVRRTQTGPRDRLSFLLTIAVALAGGFLGRLTGMPAGVLVFSMMLVLALKLTTGRGWLPLWVKRVAQVLSGAYVGCSMGYRDLLEMKYLLLPAVIILGGYILNCLLASRLLVRRFGFEPKMAMLAATPAGASDMALISADIGVNNPDLVVMQITRMILVISVFPQLIRLFTAVTGWI